MKKFVKAQAEIEFVRVFPFYIHCGNSGGYSFNVTVCTTASLRKQLGMTVDLPTLNRIATKVFVNSELTNQALRQTQTLQKLLRKKYQQLKSQLAKSKIKLRGVKFEECRGFAIEFTEINVLTRRQDFATDDDGILYSVSSYFDERNKLKILNLKNLKANIEEQFIF